MSRFDDKARMEAYKKDGTFPAIHDNIIRLVMEHTADDKHCLDLGCCVGFLAKRLVQQCSKDSVLGVEGNQSYSQVAIPDDRIRYVNLYVTDKTIEAIAARCQESNVTLCVARRVFPEIAEQGVDVVRRLGEVLHGAGIQRIALEGRVVVPNPKNPLWKADLECEALSGHYRVIANHKNCRLLERN